MIYLVVVGSIISIAFILSGSYIWWRRKYKKKKQETIESEDSSIMQKAYYTFVAQWPFVLMLCGVLLILSMIVIVMGI